MNMAFNSQHTKQNAVKCVLIVEDEVFVAMDMAATLEDAGLRVIGPAQNVLQALKVLASEHPDAAFLDVNLGRNETSEPIARRLREMGIPITIVTADARENVPFVSDQDFFIAKPLSGRELVDAVKNLGLI